MYALHVLAVLLGVSLEEKLNQRRNVLATFPQWRQVNRNNIQTIIQVFAKPARFDLVEQVAVGRGDDPGVDLDGPDIAHALEFAFLQDPQELDLELGRGAVHLVQKNAPGVRGLEPAGPVVDRAGKRALDVAEQLGFEQALGECSAVDPDIRTGEPRAEVVDGTGDQLLARARFSDDQHTCADGATCRVTRTTSRIAALGPIRPGRLTSSPDLVV